MTRDQIKNVKEKVFAIKPLNREDYEKFDIDRLIVFGMFFLEKNKVPLYFEYIVVGLFKLFPKKFSMSNFSQYPDVYRINNGVRRLAGSIKSKGVRWANGSVENGFTLTETGKEIAKQVEEFLNNPGKEISKKMVSRSRGRSPLDDVKDIRESVAFKKWNSQKINITEYEIFSLLGSMPYAPKDLLKKHFEYLKEAALAAKDKEISRFLLWVENRFTKTFN